ncbi:MAG TPA: aldehyde dehydrogenase family protein [Verrucomicrobiales bacterium]|nr:aldehyde dehydrogenase family protein [Verrucomicrobiales bacterium]
MDADATDTKTPPLAAREIVAKNPATLEELGRVPVLTEQEVHSAGVRAREAQPAWNALTFKERARIIFRARDLLVERQDEVCRLISSETGKPAVEALTSEVFPVANLMDYFARKSRKMLRAEQFSLSVFRNKKSRIQYAPHGVIGIISPWNYPFSIPMGHVVMGLMAGNAILLKPSEHSSLVGLQIGKLFEEAGLPSGLLQILTGDGSTGAALAESRIDKLFFTGSVPTGRKLAESAARRFLPVVLELGGKDAMIVCGDAPLERTVNGALWGAFNNAGQACASVERLYVVKSIAGPFIDGVVEKVKNLRAGHAGKGEYDVGPLNNARQLEIVSSHVEDAVSHGAQVLTGGRRIESLPGYFYEPTVLVNVNHSMKIMREETFGPVLPIMTVEDEAEAVRAANDSNFGLLASVWTKDIRRGKQIAARLEAGSVLISDVLYTHGAAETPWFGIKESGIGVAHSKHGLREFVRMQHLNWDRIPLKTNPWWFPYSLKKHRAFQFLLKALHKWGLKKWI